MRPVRLDLDGFASFRDPATIDFTDADYFAFVGPTGSGKSTVVDALTFALYGSAPRWGSSSSIQYALAPTANRCTVRLVFDVNGQRYVAAREVRRSGSAIQQKTSRLERYLDPNASGDPALDSDVESLADDPKAVKAQVSELLGLDFDDFCTCVVLPQGDFATFLKASVTERQNILLKLIGAKQYDTIGRMAGRRAADAASRVEAYTAQLGEYADATETAEQAARARESQLDRLLPEVERAVETITTLGDAKSQALSRLAALEAEIDVLETVHEPQGIDDLQLALTTAARTYRAAAEQERMADEAAAVAQRAVDDGPQRRPLEETLRRREEHTTGTDRLPALVAAAQAAGTEHDTALASAATAEAELEQCRTAYESAKGAENAATAAEDAIRRRIDGLAAVRVPDGVDELAGAIGAARTAGERAAAAVVELEHEVAEARDALDRLPERSALDELGRTIGAYAQTQAQVDRLTREHAALLQRVNAAEALLTQRGQALQTARDQLDQVRTRSAAAELRPHLLVGEACPVCDQTVATLPPALDVPLLDEARATVERARHDHADALADRQSVSTELAALEAQLATRTDRRDDLDRSLLLLLPDNPAGPDRDTEFDRAAQARLIAQLEEAGRRHTEATRQLLAARETARVCAAESRRLDAQADRERGRLHSTVGQLSAQETAPPLLSADGDDLARAWHELTDWAVDRAGQLSDGELCAARSAADEARARLTETQQMLAATGRTARAASETCTAAALRAQRANDDCARLTTRLAELAGLLDGQPAETRLRALLAECDRLESEARQARDAALSAGRARQHAEQAREAARGAWERARTEFHTARERLIPLEVPRVDADDLSRAWATLSAWTGEQLARRRERANVTAAELADTQAELDRRIGDLAKLVDAHGVEPPEDPARLVPVIMIERERARARTQEISRRRREAAKLQVKIDKDTEVKQVAGELQRLMSSRKFPQWLADAALDTLVADASESLLRLSNDQFDLTHEKGEFYVIDHADADSRRSVRTLSGGETFQASLALALALSEQLSTLAAGGRTTLDSIFLDEGFGTLDPDALEIVAGTLENLAQEDRMVGVITHVTALAERVPVRFEVSRDTRTSSVERVGA